MKHFIHRKKAKEIAKYLTIFVVIIGWLFSGWPQIWQFPPLPPKVQEVQAGVAPLQLENKLVDFTFTDDNSNENLIITTDKQIYIGLARGEVYFSVTNIGDKSESVGLQVYFPESVGEVTNIAKWTANMPYEVDIPEYNTMSYFCEAGWQERTEISGEALGKYQCQATGVIENCDSLSDDGTVCIVDQVQVGTHREIKYKDNWQDIGLSNNPLLIEQGFWSRLFGKEVVRKPVPESFVVKKSSIGDGYIIEANQTQYFKMDIKFPPRTRGEFYIEAIGNQEGYGFLDPWWDSNWGYKKPVNITYSSSALADYQVKIDVDTQTLITAGKMQADCDDIRFLDSGDSAGDELNYWIDSGTCNTTATVIWVKVPSISSDKTIYMYYGNGSATAGESGANTFIFFDDFPGSSLDGTKWTATNAGCYTVSSGITITCGDIYTDATVDSTPQDKIVEMKAKYLNGSASYSGINISNDQATSGGNGGTDALAYNMTQSGAAYNLTLWGADGTVSSYNIISGGSLGTPTLSTDYIMGFTFYGSSQISYFYQNTSYTDVNRLTYSGTWNQAFYLWLGYFTGSAAGSTDIDDITVRWVRVRQYSAIVPSTALGSEIAYTNVTVSSFGTQVASLIIPSTSQHVGGGFSIDNNTSSKNVTGITITEHGTVDAQNNLANVKLFYDLDTSDPYNCASESYGGGETQFGSTASFNGANGTATFAGTVEITTTQTMCVYVVLDVGSGATSSETLEIKINNPSSDVTISSGTIGPSSVVEISGTTSLLPPADLQQIHYRWRNDDGSESGNNPVWWDASWSYRKKITIDNSNIDEALSDFPVLISLSTDTDLAADAQDDGDDIVFTDSSSNKLDHEIERFDGATGELIADVKVPSISASTDTDIYIYYGNGAATDQQNVSGVWSNDFAMVYHFNEPSGTTGSNSVIDSTANTGGTPSSGLVFGESGKIASSTNFSSGTGINNGSLGSPLLTASTTISFWINATNYASPSRQNPINQAYGGWGTMTLETNGAISWFFGRNGSNGSPYGSHSSGAGLVSNGAWIYVTAVRSPDGYTYNWYKNGVYFNGSTYSSSYPVINTLTLTMGDGYVNPINGKMDEFRVSQEARSAAWVKAEHANQNSPATFYSLGSEENIVSGATFTLAEDTAMTGLAKSTLTRLRFEISNEGGETSNNAQYRLEVSEANPASCAAGSYERVSTDADWEMADSSYITEGEATSDINPGLTNENTTFVAGEARDVADETGAISLTGSEFTELEYSIQATASATGGATYCFRLTNAGSTTNLTYSESTYGKVTLVVAVSISISTDGTVDFGFLGLDTIQDSSATGINDIEVISVDTGPADLDIRSSVFTEGGNTWTLGATNGSNQVRWDFASTTPITWTNFALADTLYTLENNVAQGQTRNVILRIQMPTATDSYDQYSGTVTIVASEP